MLTEHLCTLRNHGEWADLRLLTALRDSLRDVPVALRELSHIRGAQETWLSRLERRAATLPVWPDLSIVELEQAGASIDVALASYFAALDSSSMSTLVTYINSAGNDFATSVGDILLQMLTHGQYHRGKANVALSAAGIQPVGVDYIVWQRERGKNVA